MSASDLNPKGKFSTLLRWMKPGDQIAVKVTREDGSTFYHHGIFYYYGSDESSGVMIATLCGDFNHPGSAEPSSLDILEFILSNADCSTTKSEIVKIVYDQGQELPPEEVVDKAKEVVMARKWEFDAETNSSEHFATMCKTGVQPTPELIVKLREAVEEGLEAVKNRDQKRIERLYDNL